MPDPTEVTRGLGDMIRQGLGMFGQGVSTVAEVLKSGDAALQQVDGALTGDKPRPVSPATQPAASEEDVAQRVASLVRQGRDEATRTGDPKSTGVVAHFQDAIRMLFQAPLPGDAGGLSDLVPSPAEAVRMGLRDLRGSMALVRLANGTGSLADAEEVASFAEDLLRRIQAAASPAMEPQSVAGRTPADQAPPPPTSAKGRSTRKRSSRRRRKQAPDSSAVAFAQAVAEEMGDVQVTGWAEEFAAGKITESTWVSRLTDHAARTRESLDDVFRRAQGRMQGKSGE